MLTVIVSVRMSVAMLNLGTSSPEPPDTLARGDPCAPLRSRGSRGSLARFLFRIRTNHYFPIQNRSKIACSASSTLRCPLISSMHERASARSAATSSSGRPSDIVVRARVSAARARSRSSTCRMFVIAGVSRCRSSSPSVCAIRWRSRSMPLPSGTQTSMASASISRGDHAAGRSDLLTTTTRDSGSICASSARSSSSSARERSRTSSVRCARSAAARARDTPSASTASFGVSRMPAVSTSVTAMP